MKYSIVSKKFENVPKLFQNSILNYSSFRPFWLWHSLPTLKLENGSTLRMLKVRDDNSIMNQINRESASKNPMGDNIFCLAILASIERTRTPDIGRAQWANTF